MGYLSCRADSSIATCRSISSIVPVQPHKRRNFTSSKSKSKSKSKSASAADLSDGAVLSDDDGGKKCLSAVAAAAGCSIRRFSYAEVEAATSNFSESVLLGRGSHGAVYKAVLRGFARPVAVKRPSRRRPPSPPAPAAARDEVENEIDILSSLRGPRLVNLLGFSASDGGGGGGGREVVLVMEYMPNGTLYDLLHSNPRPPGWARRMRLALQTAKALLTLHSARPPVIHRDVKSANVLLDRNLDARLGDFGSGGTAAAAASASASASAAGSTPPAGTLGYLDPSYVTPDSLSTKTDVFSFGILLLEIMSGRKAIDVAHSPPSVVEWAVPLLRKGKVAALFDPRIPPPRDPAARRRLAGLAASCVRSCRERRPSMDQVVDQLKALSRTLPSRAWNGLVVGNPCSVVDTQGGAISKLRPHGGLNSELRFINEDEIEEPEPSASAAAVEEEKEKEEDEDEDEETLIFAKKPPSAAAKGSRPSRNAKVFSEAGTRESRNLMELMADSSFVSGQRSIISRARTVHLARSVCDDKNSLPFLRRNQTVRTVLFEKISS
ncbi:serine/threonine-protein kinase-like protein At3g51990 [Ananas comosus]|uniref:Serine/threonine-protein kinase-like protein At3g51990 n=1 Tax=Ananas comosus TaxID=4615 RepID=A0A6P5EXA0_ANACO|nr:serine/threonine-protein kinase-like protein At3g51990 [Ananas comosus]